MPFSIRSCLIFLWAVVGILQRKNSKGSLKHLIIFISPYILLLCSLFYTVDLKYGFNELFQMIGFPIIGIVFYLNRNYFDSKKLRVIFSAFATSVLVLFAYLSINVFLNYSTLKLPPSTLEIENLGIIEKSQLTEEIVISIKNRRVRNFVGEVSGSSTTYLGLFIVSAVYMLFSKYMKLSSRVLKTIIILAIIFLLANLFFIGSRISIITLLFITVFLILQRALVFNKSLTFFFLITAFIILFISSRSFDRFKEITPENFSLNKQKHQYNSLDTRLGIYLCATSIIKQNFVFGVGVGDTKDRLQNCYTNNLNSKVYEWQYFNTHNQFLHFFLACGLFGFLSYFLSLVFQFMHSRSRHNQNYSIIVIIVIIFSISENVLLRNDGLIFYSFFTGLMLFNNE